MMCNLVNFSGPGGWDITGVSVDDRNDTFIRCNSTHLTCFAVLVDISGGTSKLVSSCIILWSYLVVCLNNRNKVKLLLYQLYHILAVEFLWLHYWEQSFC